MAELQSIVFQLCMTINTIAESQYIYSCVMA